jgi:hypothetical protein
MYWFIIFLVAFMVKYEFNLAELYSILDIFKILSKILLFNSFGCITDEYLSEKEKII